MPKETFAMGQSTVRITPKVQPDFYLEYDVEVCSIKIDSKIINHIADGNLPDKSIAMEAGAQLEMGEQSNLRMIVILEPNITDRARDLLSITKKKAFDWLRSRKKQPSTFDGVTQ